MMSEEEKAAYLAEVESHVNSVADAWLLKHHGRTFRGDADDTRRAARLARLAHGQQNGSARPQDSMEKIRADYPDLFGTPDDAA
jgi:hypothetical protein